MNEEIFGKICELLEACLPKNWSEVFLFAGYSKDSYSMKYLFKTDSGILTDCFNLPAVTDDEIIKLFAKLNDILSKERSALEGKNKWSVLKLTIKRDGAFNADFDYTDHSEDMLSYEIEWEKAVRSDN